MPNNIENNFSPIILDFIQPGGTLDSTFEIITESGDFTNNFIRITVNATTYFSYTLKKSDGSTVYGLNGFDDFIIYQDENGNLYLKPNDLLDNFEVPDGTYTLKIDFLNKFTVFDRPFLIREISPSRLEVRLKLSLLRIFPTKNIDT